MSPTPRTQGFGLARRLARVVVVASLAALPLAAVAADSVESLGFDPVQLENSLFGALRGWYGAPSVPAAVRALPAEQKVAAVKVLGEFAKAYFASAEFKKGYAEAYKSSKPRRFGLPSIDPKALAKQAAEKAIRGGKGGDPNALDKDPKAQLKRRLEAFLAATSDVDFGAKTEGAGSYKRFASEEYEAKPSEWKMCYRAGKETTEALRAFASSWLAELN